jgi:hypothetical protein
MQGLGSQLCNHVVQTVIRHTENRLKLWHVRVEKDLGYDTHDSFVVAAYTEDEARHTCPEGGTDFLKCWTWILEEEIPQLIVTCIGFAAAGVTFRQILCASYNAG